MNSKILLIRLCHLTKKFLAHLRIAACVQLFYKRHVWLERCMLTETASLAARDWWPALILRWIH